MENTEHYNLNLPDGEDIYNINDFNQNTEKIDDLIYDINEDIADMKVTFQAGVDSIYNACVTKGSTPDSHALSDVVQGILDIETGGGSGDCYSMFPQEIPRWRFQPGGCMVGDIQFENGTDTFVAHIVASDNNSIMLNFLGYYWQIYAITSGTLSLVIDGSTVIQNIASFSFDPNDYPEASNYDIEPRDVMYSFSYTLPTSLSTGYHTLSLRPIFNEGYSVEFINVLFNFYGSNFVAVQNPGYYLLNGVFSNYYTPSGFVVPTNPITYQLTTLGSSSMEDIDDAMNNYYSSTFDSGASYHIQGIWGYDTTDGYIVPDIADTLTYSNGKIIYNHEEARTFPSYDSDVGVLEEHYFVLPIAGTFWRIYDYITIHGKVIYKGGTMNHSDSFRIGILKRVSSNQVEFVTDDHSFSFEYSSEDDEFVLSFDTSNIPNNRISFIVLFFEDMDSSDDPYTIEIDKIWGTYYDMGDD